MRACDKCLENSWKYSYKEGWILATCKLCGYDVEFSASNKNPSKKTRRNFADPCKCGGKLLKQESSLSSLKRKQERLKSKKIAYYFKWSWRCLNCNKVYLDNDARVE